MWESDVFAKVTLYNMVCESQMFFYVCESQMFLLRLHYIIWVLCMWESDVFAKATLYTLCMRVR